MRFKISLFTSLSTGAEFYLAETYKLIGEIFDAETAQKVERTLPQRLNWALWVAHTPMDPPQVLGFKLGYELERDKFYSWMGGVIPTARNYGIASELIFAQHEWAKKQGYRSIRTKTTNQWKNMMILNLRNGFDVVGCEDREGQTRVILEKNLA